MDRNQWKGALRRVRTTFRRNTSPSNNLVATEKRRRKLNGRIAWIGLAVAAIMVLGAALSAARMNTSVPLPGPTQPDMFYGDQARSGSSLSSNNPPVKPADGSSGVIGGSPQEAVADQSSTGSTNQSSQPWDRMVIRTATLQITVKDVSASLDAVQGMAGASGGYVTQTESHQDGEYTIATITIQVPAKEFDGVVSQLRKIGVKPVQESITSSDVTEEYTDLQSQLRNMQATEQRVLALMTKAEKIDDILTLDRELRQVRGDIEQAQGRINYLSKRSELSTITVSLYPNSAPLPLAITNNSWNPGEIASTAWNASLDMLAGVGKVVITASVFVWWAVPLLLAIWLVTRPRRRGAAGSNTTSTEAP